MSTPTPATSEGRRIVYVWDADYPWDVRVEKTCLALTQAGHEVHIVARNRKWSLEVEQLPEGTVHRMPPWRWVGRRADAALGFPAFFSPRWRSLISRVVRETSADLIIARDLPLCPTAIHVGRKFGIPVILDMAENYPAMMRAIWETGRNAPLDCLVRNPRLVEAVERYCLRHSDHVIAVVEESAERLMRLGVTAAAVTVISNTPPAGRVSDAASPARNPEGPLTVVYMGNVEVARGLLEALDAVAQLKLAGSPVRLRIIGRGRDDSLVRSHAAALGLGSDEVEFLGYIKSHCDALAIVAAGDVGLLPHRKCEAWDTTIPNKMFDYMALGLPVASSNTAPCERILLATQAGRVFKSGDAAGLAALLDRFRSFEERERVGRNGQSAILSRYNWEHDRLALLDVVTRVARSDARHVWLPCYRLTP